MESGSDVIRRQLKEDYVTCILIMNNSLGCNAPRKELIFPFRKSEKNITPKPKTEPSNKQSTKSYKNYERQYEIAAARAQLNSDIITQNTVNHLQQ